MDNFPNFSKPSSSTRRPPQQVVVVKVIQVCYIIKFNWKNQFFMIDWFYKDNLIECRIIFKETTATKTTTCTTCTTYAEAATKTSNEASNTALNYNLSNVNSNCTCFCILSFLFMLKIRPPPKQQRQLPPLQLQLRWNFVKTWISANFALEINCTFLSEHNQIHNHYTWTYNR